MRDLGHHRVDRLQPEHLEAFNLKIGAEGLSPATVLLHHRVISRALKVAMQRGRIARNVATLVDAPTVTRDEIAPLTAAEARRLLEVARELPNGARWSVALALGLRQGEALGLLWDAVDLEAGTLTVRRALQRHKGKGLVLVEPKSKAGRRTIKLPRPAATRAAGSSGAATSAAARGGQRLGGRRVRVLPGQWPPHRRPTRLAGVEGAAQASRGA